MKINDEAQLAVMLYRERMRDYLLHEASPGLYPNVEDVVYNGNVERAVCLDAAKLKSLARAIGRLDEAYCNRELTNREVARNVKLNEAVKGIAGQYGLRVTRNHDPRGFAVYLHFPDGSSNSWDGSETDWGI